MSVRQDGKFHSMSSEDSKCCGPCRGGCCGRFFQRGRELESIDTNHSYTEEERRDLAKFHSIDYMPYNSEVYRKWLRKQSPSVQNPGNRSRWVMMFMIGLVVGIVGFLLKSSIFRISNLRYFVANILLESGSLAGFWVWIIGYSVLIVFISAALVVFIQPAAAASGIPETISYLNGAHVPKIFNIRTMVVKFFSCVCAVGSGLPVGPEGPMIHLGAMLGKGLSQGQSRTMGFATNMFKRFRNMRDRRDFISAGAAAGVASAFGAPVGGLLFSMEEVSSFWTLTLSWQTFFCCMVSTTVTDWLLSSFGGFRNKVASPFDFGLFKDDSSLLFRVEKPMRTHMLMFIPTVVIGLGGGLLGAIFTFFNLKWARCRKKHIAGRRALRILEPCLIMLLWAILTLAIPALMSECKPTECGEAPADLSEALKAKYEHHCSMFNRSSPFGMSGVGGGNEDPRRGFGVEELANETLGREGLTRYTCPETMYNEAASLMYVNGEECIKLLFTRKTHYQFTAGPLFALLIPYFILACMTMGSAISSGVVVPMLLIGGCYGRLCGLFIVYITGSETSPGVWQYVYTDEARQWIDPGAFALIGAASFFGGVSRLTMSLTVIMMEITNDIHFLLPIMVAIMCAKLVADSSTHSLYHALIELKCIPFLDHLPSGPGGVSLELSAASDIMANPVETLPVICSVRKLAQVLRNGQHHAFPVVSLPPGDAANHAGATREGCFLGLILREHLRLILTHEDLFRPTGAHHRAGSGADVEEGDGIGAFPTLEYEVIGRLEEPSLGARPAVRARTETDATRREAYAHQGARDSPIWESQLAKLDSPEYDGVQVNLMPYANTSAFTVTASMSLERTYLLFRTMGLRHLPVIDGDNQPIGMITRKDLMAFNIDESISGHHHSHSASPFGPGGGTETVNPIDGVEMSESKQDLKMS